MFVVLGATGKVGGASAAALRAAGRQVRAVVRDADKAGRLIEIGCEIAAADIQDPIALAEAMRDASAVQVILPIAPQAENARAVMREMIASLVEALQTARPPLILAISDYGAEIDERTGITLLYHEFEVALRKLPARLILLRSAEHMENISRTLPRAIQARELPSLHQPLTKLFPTVSARDVGQIAAELLLTSASQMASPSIVHVEGPRRYSALDVAQFMTAASGLTITARELPRADWENALRRGGLSGSYAELICELFEAHNAGRIDAQAGAGKILRGRTEFSEVIKSSAPPGHG